MIKLFSTSKTKLDLSQYDNLLHGSHVSEFEHKFSEYVGFKYPGLATCNASCAIFLILKIFGIKNILLPDKIPPTVVNYVLHAGVENITLYDDGGLWIGNSYTLTQKKQYTIIDSAQEVLKPKVGFLPGYLDNFIHIYSFYPTKPVSGIEGGMICCNDRYLLGKIREYAYYGATQSNNSWDKKHLSIGYKMYMNSLQATVANESLDKLDKKYERLDEIAAQYLRAGLRNSGSRSSKHLYRIYAGSSDDVIELKYNLERCGIQCGIHYYPISGMDAYMFHPNIEYNYSVTTNNNIKHLSIPFHEDLTDEEVDFIIEKVYEYRKNC